MKYENISTHNSKFQNLSLSLSLSLLMIYGGDKKECVGSNFQKKKLKLFEIQKKFKLSNFGVRENL